jgi:hypothetical protein
MTYAMAEMRRLTVFYGDTLYEQCYFNNQRIYTFHSERLGAGWIVSFLHEPSTGCRVGAQFDDGLTSALYGPDHLPIGEPWEAGPIKVLVS